MSDSIFKGVELVGTSSQSFSHAIEVAVERARKTLHGLSWFVVEEMRGGLQQGRLQYQVTLRVFFKLDDVSGVDESNDAAGAGQEILGSVKAGGGAHAATRRSGKGRKAGK